MEFIHPEEVIRQLDIKPGMTVADFGSGSGAFTILLAKAVGPRGKVHALDVLKETLDIIQGKARIEGLFNIETVWVNLEVPGGSKQAENSQDFVLIANILFQSAKKSDIIAEAKRILKPGGRMAILEWRPEAKGVGPEEGYRISTNECIKLATDLGLIKEKEFAAGEYHWGLIFKK